MSWRISIATLALALAAAIPAGAQARDSAGRSDLLLRIGAPVHVAAGDSISNVWVINGDAMVDGVVRQELVIIGGTAIVTGTVRGGVAVINGTLELASTARVGRDVYLHRSTLRRAPGAAVQGVVERSRGIAFGQGLAWAFWLGMTLVVVAAGVVFAAIAGVQLTEAASLGLRTPARGVVATLAVWAGLPVVAALRFATVIGIPLGCAVLFFLLPTLGFAGYLVAGAMVGGAALGRGRVVTDRPYDAVVIGLLILQGIGFIPIAGGLVVMLSAAYGAGLLALRSWERRRRRSEAAPVRAAAAA